MRARGGTWEAWAAVPPQREASPPEQDGGPLGADLVASQTAADARTFLDCVRHFLELRVVEGPPAVALPGREVRVVALPVGVDAERLRAQAAEPAVREQAQRLRAALGAE